MSLFQCENCGCVENTALASQGFKNMNHLFDWSYAPELKGKLVCSACGPTKYASGAEIKHRYGKAGEWHNKFDRMFLPIGKFKTNGLGNLSHIETGEDNYRPYILKQSENKNI